MKQLFLFKAARFFAYSSFIFCVSFSSYAGTNELSCAYKVEQQFLGALPGFSNNSDPLFGFRCGFKPYISSFLGNWFPSLPKVSISQGKRQSGSDYNQAWLFSLAIKRLGQGELYASIGQEQSQQVLTTQEAISFVSASANQPSDASLLNKGQRVRLSQSIAQWQIGVRSHYQLNQPLTELAFRQISIDQPIQATVTGFEKQSLFQSVTSISEIALISESSHRGLNINWQFALGTGQVKLKPERIIDVEKSQQEILTLKGILEVYYQYRLNRRWFAYTSWIGELNYWQQATSDKSAELAPYDLIKQQAHFGLGLSF